VVPKTIEIRAQRFDAGWVQLVEPAVPLRTIDDQMRVLQNSQVLRNRRPADRETTGQFSHRLGPVEQPLEDGPPGRIA